MWDVHHISNGKKDLKKGKKSDEKEEKCPSKVEEEEKVESTPRLSCVTHVKAHI